VGSSTGALLFVDNNGSAAFDTYGVLGVAGVGPYSIGVLGYGANNATANLALTGYDIGPGSIATVGDAVYPEPAGGPAMANQTTGVLGLAANGDGVMGQTSVQHGCCKVAGEPSESNQAGVVGVDEASNNGSNSGVVGYTLNGAYGVEGISGNSALGGVEGNSTTGDGVDGYSDSGYGVNAQSNAVALNAASTGHDGIDATTTAGGTNAGEGVIATASYHAFLGKGYVGLEGQSADVNSYPLVLIDHTGNNVVYVTDAGDLYYHGTLSSFVATQSGGVGRMFVPRSTMQTMEDFGSGTLVNGSGVVHLDPAFAKMMDGTGYQVFLTPDGDNRGLYVAQKTANSFLVRESQGGHSSLAFDYRIVARQYGHAADRATIAASAAAFKEPQAEAPSARQGGSASTQQKRGSSSARSGMPNAFAIPRAVQGLSQSLGH
jgi:hypothetical protein